MLGYIFLVGIGLALLFSRNASTGGIEVVAKLMNKYLRMDLGRATSLSGMLVALSSALCFDAKTVFSAFWALIWAGSSWIISFLA